MPAGTSRTTLEPLEVGEWVDEGLPTCWRGSQRSRARHPGSASPARPVWARPPFISALISTIRAEGRTVGVIAVDPSSPMTSGALLGDRIRLQDHIEDPGVYVRSVAGRGHLGGLSEAVPRIATVLGGAGFDLLLIETLGVGQSEVEVMRHVDTTVVVVTPGWGDSVQTAKAGVLEIGDV